SMLNAQRSTALLSRVGNPAARGEAAACRCHQRTAGNSGRAGAGRNTQHATLVVASVEALQQRTFPPNDLKQRTRDLNRGDRFEPLDLVQWLEEQGYEPEAQVTQKGELALRGGILDIYPPTHPWPVRLECFGDELESLRYFDPLTQISREEIAAITIPPAGELGILKKAESGSAQFESLIDFLPPETMFLVCEP